jgi:hypothetical protein
MELRIGDRTAPLAHARFTESRICLQQSLLCLLLITFCGADQNFDSVVLIAYRRVLYDNGRWCRPRMGWLEGRNSLGTRLPA